MASDAQNRIAAVIPTFRRIESLRRALTTILSCQPPPDEVLVHVDAGDNETGAFLERQFSQNVRWLGSSSKQGPGGGRNRLIRASRCELVASFDDDSWPIDDDYFSSAANLMSDYPKAAVLTGNVCLRDELPNARSSDIREVPSFEAGACVFRRAAFVAT